MFADDTNLFCSNKKHKTVISERKFGTLKNILMVWGNKLSLNEDETRFTLFYRHQDRDNLSLGLPALKINDYEIKWPSLIKFLEILVDEHLGWIDHINFRKQTIKKLRPSVQSKTIFKCQGNEKSLFLPFP